VIRQRLISEKKLTGTVLYCGIWSGDVVVK